MVWAQDICLKMAFMKSVMQIANAIRNITDLEDFQFAQKTTLTAILMVSLWHFLGPGGCWGLTLLTGFHLDRVFPNF